MLGDDKLNQLDPIRQSQVHVRSKEVVLLTPVLITAADFTTAYAPTRLLYATGDRLNQLAPPAIEQVNSGGLII